MLKGMHLAITDCLISNLPSNGYTRILQLSAVIRITSRYLENQPARLAFMGIWLRRDQAASFIRQFLKAASPITPKASAPIQGALLLRWLMLSSLRTNSPWRQDAIRMSRRAYGNCQFRKS